MAFTDRLHNRGSVSTGYDIDQSATFDYTRNQWIERTIPYNSGRGNDSYRKATFSLWLKRGNLATDRFFLGGSNSARYWAVKFNSSNKLEIYTHSGISGYNGTSPITTRQFLDASAWYHLVFRWDTTLSTAGDRFRLYVNGVEEDTWDTAPNIDQNAEGEFTTLSNVVHVFGGQNGYYNSTGSNFDGQIAEINYLANTSAGPDEFGETNTDGQWVPIDTSSVSSQAAADSYRIDFGATDSSNPFNDTTSANQDFSNASSSGAPRIGTDTPTNNFMTWNPLTGHYNDTDLYLAGANHVLQGQNGAYQLRMGTIGINPNYTSAKWYWELKNTSNINSSTGPEYSWGVATETRWMDIHNSGSDTDFRNGDGLARYVSSYNTGGNGTGANTVWGVMVDCSGSNPVINLYRNGSSVYTYTYTAWSGRNFDEFLFPSGAAYGSGSELVINSGGGYVQEFTVDSSNTDANGYGSFEYAPPSGALALCTKNLADDGGGY